MHRSTYGRPWSLGKHFFDFLKEQGLQKHHKVLDFGCGSGRLGIHLIEFLDKGCYYGIESHANSLRAFAEYEIPKSQLAGKTPRLLLDRKFNFKHFNSNYDLVIETSVTQHIYDDNMIKIAYENIAQVLKENGQYLVSPRLRFSDEQMSELNLKRIQDLESHFSDFEGSPYAPNTYWSKYVKT